jgi:hypothetical protein
VFGKSKDERRGEVRKAANRRALLLAAGLEIECRIVDESRGGVRLRLDHRLDVKGPAILVDMSDATALDLDVAWIKGQEAGGRTAAQVNLRGLVPQRLAAARAAWQRAGGR